MFYTCGPNEAMVVSGFGRSRPLMIVGGRVFVFPYIQQIQKITLNIMTLNVKTNNINTLDGVPISVTGTAQVKIHSGSQEMLAMACQIFLGKSEAEIAQIAMETLEGHQAAVIGHHTVQEMYHDCRKFTRQVYQEASSDLYNMGITIVSYTLKDVHKDQGAQALQTANSQRDFNVEVDTNIEESERTSTRAPAGGMFHSCGSNEAMVVSGFGQCPPSMIVGGSVVVFPCFQQIQRISLKTMTLNVKSDRVHTRRGVPISLTGTAQVKIQGQHREMLAMACEMLLSKSEAEIAQIALDTLQGHQAAVICHHTVEEISQDPRKFSEKVLEEASYDLLGMGIGIVSYSLEDFHDNQEGQAVQEVFAQMAKSQRDFEQKDGACGSDTTKVSKYMPEDEKSALIQF